MGTMSEDPAEVLCDLRPVDPSRPPPVPAVKSDVDLHELLVTPAA